MSIVGLRGRFADADLAEERADRVARALDPGRFVQTRENRLLRESWIGLSLVTVFLGLAAGEIVIALVGSGIFVAGWLARLWGRLALSRLDVFQDLSIDHAFVGETIRYRMRISNRKLLPLPWLSLRTEVPEALEPIDRHLEPIGTPKMARLDRLTGLRWYERLTWEYTIPLKTRGYFTFGRTALRAGDLFGFFTRERIVPEAVSLWVYPQVLALETLGLPMLRPMGEERGVDPLFDDPSRLRGLREYQTGDPLRRVDWRATAKRQSLQTRTFDPASSRSVLLALNVATMPEAWQGFYGELFERAVAVCASLASSYAEVRFPFGLVANCTYPGRDGTIRMPLGRAQAQTIRALELLAMADVYAVATMERVLQDESQRLPRGSSVVLVTAVMTRPLVGTLLDLRRRGLGVSLVWVGRTPPLDLPPSITVHDLRSALADRRFYHPHSPEVRLDEPEMFAQARSADAESALTARAPDRGSPHSSTPVSSMSDSAGPDSPGPDSGEPAAPESTTKVRARGPAPVAPRAPGTRWKRPQDGPS
ncbi:MAG: Uncharacterized conserved protein, DUF58 family, contains vWF domain [Chloroflexi bacterium]|nr:MAG: Uncharacterized conserved protein, DUF58 family, contains vWF domain [Chloroflexota bacterium]